MKVTRALGKIVKPFVNFPRWIGWSQIAADGKTISKMAKDLTEIKPTAKRVETFEQAVERLKLSEEDLQKRKKAFLQSAIFYALFSLALFAYAIYLLFWKTNFIACLIALAVSALALAFAYREHFWYFQMRQRRLGCNFKEWFLFTFRGVRK